MAKKLVRRTDDRLKASIDNYNETIANSNDLEEARLTGRLLTTLGEIPLSSLEPGISCPEPSQSEVDIARREVSITKLYAAPDLWNFWSPLGREAMIELMESIAAVGVIHNVVVWEISKTVQEEFGYPEGYMILSGHNRVEAVKRLDMIYHEPKYRTVPALVYQADSINVATARKIIDDANLINREVSAAEKTTVYMRRVRQLQESETYRGLAEHKLHEIIAAEEQTSKIQIYRYLKLRDLIQDLAPLVGKEIPLKIAATIAGLPAELQQHVYDTYYVDADTRRACFTAKNLSKLRALMTAETIDRVMTSEVTPTVEIKRQVPVNLVDAFNRMADAFLRDNK